MTDFIEFDELPRLPLKDREPFLVLERGSIGVDDGGLVVFSEVGRTQVPVGAVSALMLEPGISITHDAVKLCGKTRTLLVWVSEAGTRLYAAGSTGHGPAENKQRQVQAWATEAGKRAVARRMYARRFGEEPDAGKDLDQLRGMEGIRVRALYKVLAEQAGVVWHGRRYDPADWGRGDAANKALSAANACLYAVTEAALLISGFDPALGFLHSGSQTAFVQDVADLHKFDLTVPIAFQEARRGDDELTNRIRRSCRDAFRRRGLLDRIIKETPGLFEGA